MKNKCTRLYLGRAEGIAANKDDVRLSILWYNEKFAVKVLL